MSDTPSRGNLTLLVKQAGVMFGIDLEKGLIDVDLTDYAKLKSPVFTGVPKAPTAASGTSTKQIATTEFVALAMENLVAGEIDLTSYAKLASPNFGGVPTAPTATPGTNSNQVATTEFVMAALGTGSGELGNTVGLAETINGTSGTATSAARSDHSHPYPETTKTINGNNLKTWYGTSASVPETRSSDTIYFVTES